MVVCLLTLLLVLSSVSVLQIREPSNNNQLLYQLRMNPNDSFSIHWIHSVTKQPVIETYYVQEELTIGIKEMLFNEHGPNLPAGPEGGTKMGNLKMGCFACITTTFSF